MDDDKEKVFANWSNLPSDPLQLIADHLKPDMINYIRFRRVCTSWRSSTIDPHLVNSPPQAPWLILGFDNTTNKLHLLLPYDREKHSITLPELHDKFIGLSYQGWLVIEDHRCSEIFLFNPITRKRLHFPSSTFWNTQGKRIKYGIDSPFVSAIATDSAPNSPHCTYVVYLQIFSRLAAFRDGSWTVMNADYKGCRDVIFFEGKFFAATFLNEVLVFDSNNLQRVATIPCRDPDFRCQLLQFVEFSGKLVVVHTKQENQSRIVVSQIAGIGMISIIVKRVEMLELDFEGPERYKWRERRSIREWMMFAGSSPAFLFPADRFSVKGQEDSVYISENLKGDRPEVYSFKNNSMEMLPWDITKLLKDNNVRTSRWHKPCFQ